MDKLYRCSWITNRAQEEVIQVFSQNLKGIERSFIGVITELTGHREKLNMCFQRNNSAQGEGIHVLSQK